MDLAVVDTGATPGIFVIKNTSAGAGYSFATAVKTAYPALVSATAAPFTSAVSDLLVYDGAKLSVLSNNGSGTFTAGFAALAVPNATTLYAAADANGDGHADVYTAVPNANGAALTVDLLSGTASASSAPFALAAGTKAVSRDMARQRQFRRIDGDQLADCECDCDQRRAVELEEPIVCGRQRHLYGNRVSVELRQLYSERHGYVY